MDLSDDERKTPISTSQSHQKELENQKKKKKRKFEPHEKGEEEQQDEDQKKELHEVSVEETDVIHRKKKKRKSSAEEVSDSSQNMLRASSSQTSSQKGSDLLWDSEDGAAGDGQDWPDFAKASPLFDPAPSPSLSQPQNRSQPQVPDSKTSNNDRRIPSSSSSSSSSSQVPAFDEKIPNPKNTDTKDVWEYRFMHLHNRFLLRRDEKARAVMTMDALAIWLMEFNPTPTSQVDVKTDLFRMSRYFLGDRPGGMMRSKERQHYLDEIYRTWLHNSLCATYTEGLRRIKLVCHKVRLVRREVLFGTFPLVPSEDSKEARPYEEKFAQIMNTIREVLQLFLKRNQVTKNDKDIALYMEEQATKHISLQDPVLMPINDQKGADGDAILPGAEVVDKKERKSDFFDAMNALLDLAKQHCLVVANGILYQKTGPMTYEVYGVNESELKIDEHGTFLAFAKIVSKKECNPDLHRLLNKNGTLIKSVSDHIMSNNLDSRLPRKNRYRGWQGFNNGVLDVVTGVFYPYDSQAFQSIQAANPEKASHIAVNRHPLDFPLAEMAWHCLRHLPEVKNPMILYDATKDHWMQIPTLLDKILDDQKFPLDERMWMWAEAGALHHKRKDTVLWNHLPLLTGRGGTGKTMWMGTHAKIYSQLDVFQFNTQDESTFLMSTFRFALIFMAFDLGSKVSGMDTTTLLRIADSGWIKAPVKGKDAVLFCVDQFGMLCGNSGLRFDNNNGQWSRRILPHYFEYKPEHIDGQLEQKLEANMAYSIFKSVLAIRWLNQYVRSSDGSIESLMPQSMKNTLKKLEQETSSIRSFMASSHVKLQPNVYVSYDEFNMSMKHHSRNESNLPFVKLNLSECAKILEDNGIKAVYEERFHPVRKRKETCMWLINVTLTTWMNVFNTNPDLLTHPNPEQTEAKEKKSHPRAHNQQKDVPMSLNLGLHAGDKENVAPIQDKSNNASLSQSRSRDKGGGAGAGAGIAAGIAARQNS